MEDPNSKIVTVTGVVDVALSFPDLPLPAIERAYLVETIDSIFEAGLDCVLLEGPEQIGKTYLAAQFALTRSRDCFTLFLGSFNGISADPAQVRYDLGNQIHWYLTGKRLDLNANLEPEAFRNLVFVLQRKIRVENTSVYFVIDGVDAASEASPGLQHLLASSLPLGSPGFRFVLSASSSLVASVRNHARIRPHTLSPFSLPETQRFLSDLKIDADLVVEIHRTVRGIPGHLSAVRRLIDSGHDAGSILEKVGEGAPDIFEPEWRCVDSDDADLLRALSAIAYLPECTDLTVLGAILEAPLGRLIDLLRDITFLRLDERKKTVAFVSDSFQRYVRRRLNRYENETLDAAIKRLSNLTDTDESLRLLPDYLQRRERLTELSAYLTSRRISDAISSTHSVSSTLSMLASVRDRAMDADVEGIALRCVFARLVLSDVVSPDLMEVRVEAALAQKDDASAISIANAAELNEQRLALLALVGRVQKTRGTEADPAIVEEIRRLATSVDFRTLGDHAIDIAADLALCVPDLAARALKSSPDSENDPNAMDLAIVRSTMRALGGSASAQVDAEILFSEVDKLAGSDVTRKGMRNIALLWTKGDAGKVLEGIGSLTTTSEQLFFARQWLRINSRCDAAIHVALGITRLILADTAYAPNATIFRDLSLPLVHASPSEDAHKLLSFLDGQSEYARSKGPLADYFRMRLRLARTRLRWTGSAALAHFEDEALAIDEVKDVAIRAACYGWLIRALRGGGIGEGVKDTIGLMPYARSELHKSVSQLLDETADHTEATQVVLRALAGPETEEAISIVARLNTERRRDEGYVVIGETLLSESDADVGTTRNVISRLFSLISDALVRQRLAAQYLFWLGETAEKGRIKAFDASLVSFAIEQIPDPDIQTRALAVVAAGFSKSTSSTPENSQLMDDLRASWKSIEDDGRKTRTGYQVIASFGATTPTSTIVEFTRELNDFAEPRLATLGLQGTWYQIVLLHGRCVAALAAVRAANDDDVAAIERSAHNILSQVEQARYLSRCALYLSQSDSQLAKKFIGDYVAPRIAEVLSVDPGKTTEVKRMVIEAAPSMWLYHTASALRYIGRCDYQTRQWALNSTLEYIMKGRIPGEPWSHRKRQRRQVTEPLINDVVTLLREVDSEQVLARTIESLAECIRDRHAGARLNSNQRAHLVASLREIIKEKFPNKRGIQHEGYIVHAQAQLLSLDVGRFPEWQALTKRAQDLPNLSDSCYVLTLLCGLIPRRFDELRRISFDEAVAKWRRLPTIEERLSRLEAICESCTEFYETEVRGLLKESLAEFSPETNPSASNSYRALVEVAHKIDEEWAASLVSLTDADPARLLSRSEARRRLEQLKIQGRLTDQRDEAVIKASLEDLARACWDELSVLNASQIPTLEWDGMIDLLRRADSAPLIESYPIVAFVLASACVKYRGVAGAQEKIRIMHNAVCQAAEMLSALARSKPHDGKASVASELLKKSSYLFQIAEPGSREKVFASLLDWLRDTRPKTLDIVDPYYRPADGDILSMFARGCPECQIRILTSLHAQEANCSTVNLSEALRNAWASTGQSGEPPQIAVYVVGRASDGHMGIHDRWWLSDSGGLEFGSSMNGLGRDKTSIIRAIDPQEVMRLRGIVDPYFQLLKRTHEGQRLSYITATI